MKLTAIFCVLTIGTLFSQEHLNLSKFGEKSYVISVKVSVYDNDKENKKSSDFYMTRILASRRSIDKTLVVEEKVTGFSVNQKYWVNDRSIDIFLPEKKKDVISWYVIQNNRIFSTDNYKEPYQERGTEFSLDNNLSYPVITKELPEYPYPNYHIDLKLNSTFEIQGEKLSCIRIEKKTYSLERGESKRSLYGTHVFTFSEILGVVKSEYFSAEGNLISLWQVVEYHMVE